MMKNLELADAAPVLRLVARPGARRLEHGQERQRATATSAGPESQVRRPGVPFEALPPVGLVLLSHMPDKLAKY
jgi:hypothetical protein